MGNQMQGAQASNSAHSYPDADPSTFLPGGTPVAVNVYHLMPKTPLNGAVMGLGAFHSGVQVGDVEYTFGGAPFNTDLERPGVFSHRPRSVLPETQFHRSHLVGNLPSGVTSAQVQAVATELGDKLRGGWTTGSYNMLQRNCNHFSEKFLEELSERFVVPAAGTRLVYPEYINRAAKTGAGLLPPQMLALFTSSAVRAPPTGNATGGAKPSSSPPPPASSSGPSSSPPPPPPASENSSRPSAPKPPAPAAAARHTADELQRMSAKELRGVAVACGLDPASLLERQDYIDAILDAQSR
jgi:hypothetical protein